MSLLVIGTILYPFASYAEGGYIGFHRIYAYDETQMCRQTYENQYFLVMHTLYKGMDSPYYSISWTYIDGKSGYITRIKMDTYSDPASNVDPTVYDGGSGYRGYAPQDGWTSYPNDWGPYPYGHSTRIGVPSTYLWIRNTKEFGTWDVTRTHGTDVYGVYNYRHYSYCNGGWWKPASDYYFDGSDAMALQNNGKVCMSATIYYRTSWLDGVEHSFYYGQLYNIPEDYPSR